LPDRQHYTTTLKDDYQRPAWEAFLSAVGYYQTALATFAKRVTRTR
jgi:hypothetical protein